jgi:hypothetical protein
MLTIFLIFPFSPFRLFPQPSLLRGKEYKDLVICNMGQSTMEVVNYGSAS